MSTVRCKSCIFCESTGQEGTRGDGTKVAVGICRGTPPRINVASAGVFPPVSLEDDWCGKHPDFKLPRKARGNA